MSVTLRLATPLRDVTDGLSEVRVAADSVGELIDLMDRKYPGFRKMIFHPSGKMWPHTNIYINGNDIRGMNNLDTKLNNNDIVAILFAMAGG